MDQCKEQATVRPNLIVAGAARSGTSALSESLARHRSIYMSRPKEVHFFAHAGMPLNYRGPGDEAVMASVITDPDRFYELFGGVTEPYRCEGSVTTLYWPHRAIPNIERYGDADTKVICVLREPAARAYSAFLYLRSRGHEPFETMADALGAEAERIETGYHHMWHYEAMSRYDEQLPDFVDAFGDRLHLIVFDDFREQPEAELRRLCRFLDLAYEPRMLITTDVNRGGEVRSPALDRLWSTARSLGPVRDVATRLVPTVARNRLRARNLRQPPIDAATLAVLKTRLAPATEAVESAIGRSLPSWRSA